MLYPSLSFCKEIAQFRAHRNRWIKGQKMHLYRISLNGNLSTHKCQREEWNIHNSILFYSRIQHFPAGISAHFTSD